MEFGKRHYLLGIMESFGRGWASTRPLAVAIVRSCILSTWKIVLILQGYYEIIRLFAELESAKHCCVTVLLSDDIFASHLPLICYPWVHYDESPNVSV
jgi:hypothetical protein